MQIKDHRALAKCIISDIDGVPYSYRKAFILGNMEPDINLFTFFKGATRYKKLVGHKYENVLPVMEKYSIPCRIRII